MNSIHCYIIFSFGLMFINDIILGAVRYVAPPTAVRRDTSRHGHTKEWKYVVEYFNGDIKEFVLPSPGLRIRLSSEQAKEGLKNLKPQLFTGSIYIHVPVHNNM